MVFMEPLGSNPILQVYWKLARRAHTADERPFYRHDLNWLRATFPMIELFPFNFLSFPAGVLSSVFLKRPDNHFLKLCDAIDTWLARRISFLHPMFRHSIIVIRKPSTV